MKTIKCLGLVAIAVAMPMTIEAQTTEAQQVGEWKNVISFSINSAENHIIFSQKNSETEPERLYEAKHDGSAWSEAKPIAAVNDNVQSAGGVFMLSNERRIYFHATKNGGTENDIYYSVMEKGDWQAPQRVVEVSSDVDERSPSVEDGESGMYFLRHQVSSDEKQEKNEGDKMSIYYSKRQADASWGKAEPINTDVSFGFVQDARISADSQTLHYATRKEKKDESKIYYAARQMADSWTLPESLFPDDSHDFFSPQTAGENVYFVTTKDKKNPRCIYRMAIPDQKMKDVATVAEHTQVTASAGTRYVVAEVEVHDPTTNEIIGRYTSKADDGLLHMVNSDKQKYLVDIRSEGFSYANYQLDYDGSGQAQIPSSVELFDTISLMVNVFDGELFRPVDGTVTATSQKNNKQFTATQERPGKYELLLPLGSNYDIEIEGKQYQKSSFTFRTEGDIVMHQFERETLLDPLKRTMQVTVIDEETKEAIASEVIFDNQSREEYITKAADKTQATLREGDTYSVTVRPPSGYSFKNFDFNLAENSDTELTISVIPLRVGTSLTLNNIIFETNSSLLMTESYEELERVLQLLRENPDLTIQISAHTDNVGNASYNLKLSERRAASVVDFLLQNGANPDRLQSKGYGLTKPLVPNTSDENRQKNRRVEFSVVGQE